MPIYCDESGGMGAGVVLMAAVFIEEEAAHALLARYRTITNLHGELKGSRIGLIERGLFLELFEKWDAVAEVCILEQERIGPVARASRRLDLDAYVHVLDCAVGALLPRTGGCTDVIIDDGRYDPMILEQLRGQMAERLGNWGAVHLAHSHKCTGVQIADVIANSLYNLSIHSIRSPRIRALLQPLLDSGRIRLNPCSMA